MEKKRRKRRRVVDKGGRRRKNRRREGGERRESINFFRDLEEGLEVLVEEMGRKVRSYIKRKRRERDARTGGGRARVGNEKGGERWRRRGQGRGGTEEEGEAVGEARGMEGEGVVEITIASS